MISMAAKKRRPRTRRQLPVIPDDVRDAWAWRETFIEAVHKAGVLTMKPEHVIAQAEKLADLAVQSLARHPVPRRVRVRRR